MAISMIAPERLPPSLDHKLLAEDTVRWVQCRECRATGLSYDEDRDPHIRHVRSCDTKAQVIRRPRPPVTTPDNKARSWSDQEKIAAARRGDFRAYGTDDDLLDLVRSGCISESDAMNQDF